MTTKEIVEKELEKTRELADYVSNDFQATQRLREIREKVEIVLDAINQTRSPQNGTRHFRFTDFASAKPETVYLNSNDSINLDN